MPENTALNHGIFGYPILRQEQRTQDQRSSQERSCGNTFQNTAEHAKTNECLI